jgi:hypothetical protein
MFTDEQGFIEHVLMWRQPPSAVGSSELDVLSRSPIQFGEKRCAALGGTAERGRPHINVPARSIA